MVSALDLALLISCLTKVLLSSLQILFKVRQDLLLQLLSSDFGLIQFTNKFLLPALASLGLPPLLFKVILKELEILLGLIGFCRLAESVEADSTMP